MVSVVLSCGNRLPVGVQAPASSEPFAREDYLSPYVYARQ